MARPPIPINNIGKIVIRQVAPKTYVARCRFRQLDGKTVQVERRAGSKTAAQRALLAEVDERRGKRISTLAPHHRVSVAFDLFRDEVDRQVRDGEIVATTRDRYRYALTYVEPRIGALRLNEVSVGGLEAVFGELASRGLSASTRQLVRAALSRVFGLTVRQGALSVNPVHGVPRIITRRRKAPRSLTAEQRRQLFAWLDGRDTPAQRLAHQRGVPDMVRFMIGTGVRMGEMLAVTWADVDLEGVPFVLADSTIFLPMVRITGNIVRVRADGIVKHDGKTEKSLRTIPLPRFVADVLRARRPVDPDPSEPVFASVSRDGARIVYRDPNSVMLYIREMRTELGWPWLTTHVFRKTAATILHEGGVSDLGIGEHIGHTDRASLLNVYLGSPDVDPRLVNALDAAVRDT